MKPFVIYFIVCAFLLSSCGNCEVHFNNKTNLPISYIVKNEKDSIISSLTIEPMSSFGFLERFGGSWSNNDIDKSVESFKRHEIIYNRNRYYDIDKEKMSLLMKKNRVIIFRNVVSIDITNEFLYNYFKKDSIIN